MYAKYELKSELSENQIEADIASFFGFMSAQLRQRIRLQAVDESSTGADKLLELNGVPLFLQFKVSNGLVPISKYPASQRVNRSKKEAIREFRDEHNLGDDPSLYFKLRRKSKTAQDYQHNILRRLSSPPNRYSMYVAPLELNKDRYFQRLFESTPDLLYPFRPFLRPGLTQQSMAYFLGIIPFLKENIAIVPHQVVSTHNHYYSYSSTGFDLAWHSDEVLNGSSGRLGDVLTAIALELYDFGETVQVASAISEALTATELDEFSHGEYQEDLWKGIRSLKQTYGISTFVISLAN